MLYLRPPEREQGTKPLHREHSSTLCSRHLQPLQADFILFSTAIGRWICAAVWIVEMCLVASSVFSRGSSAQSLSHAHAPTKNKSIGVGQ